MDVVTGSLVGIICASLTLYISGMSTKEYVFSVPEDPRMSVVGTASNLSASPESIESQETVISKCWNYFFQFNRKLLIIIGEYICIMFYITKYINSFFL